MDVKTLHFLRAVGAWCGLAAVLILLISSHATSAHSPHAQHATTAEPPRTPPGRDLSASPKIRRKSKHNRDHAHTNNFAVLVSTSRYWFNYRHMANVLSVYRTVKSLGIPDSQIILMLPDDMACNARNAAFSGSVFNNHAHNIDLYGDDVEVDYRGTDVSVENFLRVLTGRHDANVPQSKRLLTNARSNVLIYMTGHGGDEFIKFNDEEEVSSHDLADAIEQMHRQGRYHEMLFMTDTCQASTLQNQFYSPNVIAIGSSRRGGNSYSHHADRALGVSVIDRFTLATLEFFETYRASNHHYRKTASVSKLFNSYRPQMLLSRPEYRSDLFVPRSQRTDATTTGTVAVSSQRADRDVLEDVHVTDFFAQVNHVRINHDRYPLSVDGDNDHHRLDARRTEQDRPVPPIDSGDRIVTAPDSTAQSARWWRPRPTWHYALTALIFIVAAVAVS